MGTNRNPTFDIMKGLAIFFVVMSHTGVSWLSTHTFASLRSPLFFIISGYFAKEWLFVDFMKNGAKRLLIPYIVTSLVMLPFVFFISLIFPENNVIEIVIKSLFLGTSSFPNVGVVELSAGPLWFVAASIWVRLLWSIMIPLKSDVIKGVVILSFAIIAFKLKEFVTLPFSLLSSFGALGFFFMGFCVRKYDLLNNPIRMRVLPICLASLIYCIGYSNLDINYCIYGAGYIVDAAGSLAAFFILYAVIERNVMLNVYFWRVLNFIGRYSLIAFCVHSFDHCLLVHWSPFKFWSYFQSDFDKICAVIIRFSFVLVGTYLIAKNKILKEKIFFAK